MRKRGEVDREREMKNERYGEKQRGEKRGMVERAGHRELQDGSVIQVRIYFLAQQHQIREGSWWRGLTYWRRVIAKNDLLQSLQTGV